MSGAVKRAVSTPSSTPIVFYFLRLTYAETMCYTPVCIQLTEPDALSSQTSYHLTYEPHHTIHTTHTIQLYLSSASPLGESVNQYSVVILHSI